MKLPHFSSRQLDTFAAVAELRSFTAAAKRVSLTASAVSQMIAELETAVGFRLFDRSTRKVTLSSAGKEFLASAHTALRHMRLAEAAAADIRNRAAGVVRVAAPMVIASVILPEAISTYQQRQPNVVVRIHDVAVEQLIDSVTSGDVDLAIGPDRAVGSEVTRVALFSSPWVLWCASSHPLAKHRRLRWSDLKDQPLVAAGRDHELSVAKMQLSLSDEERITPVEVVGNISTALGIARSGLAATLAPAYVQALAKPLGLIQRRVIDPETIRHVCLYQPTQRVASPTAEGFAEHIIDWLPRWIRTSQTRKRKQPSPATRG
jgi:DNA-binding transcriptional LysR family regulator